MIQRDKLLHIGAGAAISMGFGLLVDPLLGLALSIVAGFGKEAIDWHLNARDKAKGKPESHVVEVADIVATVLGGMIGTLIAFAVVK